MSLKYCVEWLVVLLQRLVWVLIISLLFTAMDLVELQIKLVTKHYYTYQQTHEQREAHQIRRLEDSSADWDRSIAAQAAVVHRSANPTMQHIWATTILRL